MDKLTRYRSYLQTLLTRYTSGCILRPPEVEVQLLFDTERDRCQ